MAQLRGPERSVFFVSVPLIITVTLGLVWTIPFSLDSRLVVTALVLVAALYTVLAYWLQTRKHWRGLRYTTPLVTVTIITLGVVKVSADAPLSFLLFFPAIIFSSIRAGRNIGIVTAVAASLGYTLAHWLNPHIPVIVYEDIFIAVNLLSVAVLSGEMADEERMLRRRAQGRREQEQNALLKLADALANAPDLNATREAAVEIAAQILGVDAVAIVTPAGEGYVMQAGWGLLSSYRESLLSGDGRYILAGTIASCRPIAVADFRQEQQWQPWPPALGKDLRAGVAVPMIRASRARGAFVAYSRNPRVFSGDDIHLLSLVANQTLVALERRQAEEEIRRQAARAQALVRVAARLNAHLDLTTVLGAVCEEAARALDVPIATVNLYDKKRDALPIVSAFGLPPELLERMQALPRAVYDEYSRQQGPIVVIPDVQALKDFPNADLYASMNLRTTVSASMFRKGDLVGRLNIGTIAQVRDFGEDELELLRGLADEAALAIINARLFEDNARRFKQVQALRTIDMAITGSLDLHIVLHILLEQVTAQLGIDAATVLLFHPHSQMLEYAAERGFLGGALQHTQLHLGEGHAGRAALERCIISIPDLAENPGDLGRAPLLAGEDFVSYYAVPLIAKGQIKGVLEIFHRGTLETDIEWISFLEALAGQAAIAIDNAGLLDNLQSSNAELALAYDTTLEGWSRALELRDQETEGHTQRVTETTLKLARAFGVSEADLVQVRWGALLHDIGKMGVPDAILLKPGPLTDEEWVTMKKHPTFAYEMLSPIHYLRLALDIPYCHHEKWDGTGYPRGLKGEQIPLTARIFAVVDVWDALTSDRPYRKAWTKEKVREHIRTSSGTHFDPQVVETSLRTFEENYPAKKEGST